jgi:uncharacterized protein (TIGR00297 family)
MPLLLDLVIIFGICAFITILVTLAKVFNRAGIIISFAVGMIIGVMGHLMWLILLLIFMFTSFGATKYKFAAKKEMGVQEGKKGERGIKSVLSTGLVPVLVAALSYFSYSNVWTKQIAGLLFLVAIAVAAADTVASELGIMSKNTYMITTFKRVKPGTNGGISWFGQGWALIASLYVAAVGWWVFFHFSDTIDSNPWVMLYPLIGGFLGCQIDSVLGATLEKKGYIGKAAVNLISAVLAVLMMWMVIAWV